MNKYSKIAKADIQLSSRMKLQKDCPDLRGPGGQELLEVYSVHSPFHAVRARICHKPGANV